MENILKLEMALAEGMSAEVVGDRLVLTINTDITKRDLWKSQIEMWLTEKNKKECISSGYLRISNKNKLVFKNWR